MKTLNIIPVVIALLLFVLVHYGFANDGKYEEAMKKNIQIVYSAQSIEELQQAVNAFERIGTVEKEKWEPLYYAAFGYILMANREQDGAKKDTYLDQAMTAIGKATAINPNESEIIALEGFAYMIRMKVDPASRGAQYAGLATQILGKASSINPENPRVLVLLAQMQYGTAQFFGSSTTEACGTAAKSLEKFAAYKSDSPMAPQWGRKMAEGLKEQCK
jgi:tetratricopeptide (TPR) repeat protein